MRLRNGIQRIEERSRLKSRKVCNKETLICSVIGWLRVKTVDKANKRSQTLQKIVISFIAGCHYEEARMEVTRIHIHCTEMTTLKEIVNVMEEDVISIHIDYTFIIKHIPHMQFV